MRRDRTLPLAVLLALACAAPAERASEASSVLPLRPYFRDLHTVEMRIGVDTLELLFDTGAGITSLTPAAAGRIGCTPRGRDVGHRMTGEAVTFQRCDSVTLSWPGGTSHLESIGVFDLATVLPPELPALDGIVGLDAFRWRRLVIDWPAHRVEVDAPPTPATAALPMRVATGESGRALSVLLRSRGPRGDAWLLLDSGNLRGLLVAPSVLTDSLLEPASPTEVWVRWDAARSYRMPFTRAELMIDGVLGTDFLQRGPVTLDLRAAITERP